MRKLMVLSLASVFMLGCAHSKPQINGVALPDDQKDWGYLCKDGEDTEDWMPTEAEFLAIEPAIVAYIQESNPEIAAKLDEYVCQYYGKRCNGERRIYCNFLCDDFGKDIKADLIEVDDGGDCYFQVEFNYDTREGIDFSVNGHA